MSNPDNENTETIEPQQRFTEDMEAYRRKQSREAGEEQEQQWRQKAVGGGGSWDFSALGYQNDRKTTPEPTHNGISARVLDTLTGGIDEATRLELLQGRIRNFIHEYKDSLSAYAHAVKGRKTAMDGFTNSPIRDSTPFHQFLDNIAKALTTAITDFENIATANLKYPNVTVNAWLQDSALSDQLDGILRHGNATDVKMSTILALGDSSNVALSFGLYHDDTTPRNDLRIRDNPALAAKIESASKDFASIAAEMQSLAAVKKQSVAR